MKALYLKLGGVLAASSSIVLYPYSKTKIDLYYQNTDENKLILQKCGDHLRHYLPSLFLFPHGLFQVAWNEYVAGDTDMDLNYQREFLKLEDGGQIGIDWVHPANSSDETTKICIVFPGLGGGSSKGYVKSLVHHLVHQNGYIVGVFLNRGSEIEFTSPYFIDYQSSKEINHMIDHIQDKFKHRKNVHMVGVGMSMGANLMLRVAGEQGDKFPLDAMVSLSNPFDLDKAIDLMSGTIYEQYLAREVKNQLIFKQGMTEQEMKIFEQMAEKYNINFAEVKNINNWRDIDTKIMAKVLPHFRNAKEYYHLASCHRVIANIKKPTLVIHAKDDPVIHYDCLPIDDCLKNEKIIVGVSHKGGHVCYFQGVDGQKRWYPLVTAEYLDTIIELNTDSHEDQIRIGMQQRMKEIEEKQEGLAYYLKNNRLSKRLFS